MDLAEYNRLVLSGSPPARARASFGVGEPIAVQVDIRWIRARGVRRVVTCPYCQEEHFHLMSALEKIVAAECAETGDRWYLLVTADRVRCAGLEIGRAA